LFEHGIAGVIHLLVDLMFSFHRVEAIAHHQGSGDDQIPTNIINNGK